MKQPLEARRTPQVERIILISLTSLPSPCSVFLRGTEGYSMQIDSSACSPLFHYMREIRSLPANLLGYFPSRIRKNFSLNDKGASRPEISYILTNERGHSGRCVISFSTLFDKHGEPFVQTDLISRRDGVSGFALSNFPFFAQAVALLSRAFVASRC